MWQLLAWLLQILPLKTLFISLSLHKDWVSLTQMLMCAVCRSLWSIGKSQTYMCKWSERNVCGVAQKCTATQPWTCDVHSSISLIACSIQGHGDFDKDRQPFILTFTPTANLESPVHLTALTACLWTAVRTFLCATHNFIYNLLKKTFA